MSETYINKIEEISGSHNFIGFVSINKLQNVNNNNTFLFIELGLSSFDEFMWYHFPRVWKYEYNLTNDILTGKPKFGSDEKFQFDILQVFPEILDFIKKSCPEEYNCIKVINFEISPKTHEIIVTKDEEPYSENIGGVEITKL